MEVLQWGSLGSFGESYLEGRRKECRLPSLFTEQESRQGRGV
jgi:hypothetical protein